MIAVPLVMADDLPGEGNNVYNKPPIVDDDTFKKNNYDSPVLVKQKGDFLKLQRPANG
jgi:hypothetical protein